jgi:hypothetical protein
LVSNASQLNSFGSAILFISLSLHHVLRATVHEISLTSFCTNAQKTLHFEGIAKILEKIELY